MEFLPCSSESAVLLTLVAVSKAVHRAAADLVVDSHHGLHGADVLHLAVAKELG